MVFPTWHTRCRKSSLPSTVVSHGHNLKSDINMLNERSTAQPADANYCFIPWTYSLASGDSYLFHIMYGISLQLSVHSGKHKKLLSNLTNFAQNFSHYLYILKWSDYLHWVFYSTVVCIVRSRKRRLITVGDPPRLPHDTPLSTKVGTIFCRQVAVAQSL
jgi:hypothetical protein